jgi:hypothetical protein
MTAASAFPSVTPLRDDEPSARERTANVEAEQRLLGAVLIDNRVFHRVARLLRPGDFSYAVHERIWAAIDRIIHDGGQANPVTLKTLFDQDQDLANLGGAKYLATLATSAVTVTGAEDYARLVREMAARRELIGAAETAMAEAYSGSSGSAAEIVVRLQRRIVGLECGAGRLNPLTAAEFLALDLPQRETIVDPWLPRQGLAMIHSMRGVGKTHLALSLGYAVACGAGLLGWEAPVPRRVIYLDGEMPAAAMQRRLAEIVAGFNPEPPAPDYFRLLCADETPNGLPDLATVEGQREIDAVIGEAELIVVDNLSCLARSGKENEGESWLPVQGWALAQRRAGRSVLFAHHSGKGGLQRGTSRREDVLDTVLGLRRPANYTADQGARFEVVFEKARGLHGDDAQPFEARYEERDGTAIWTRTEIADAELLRVVDALRDGMSIRETAQELGIHRSKVERLKKRADAKGMLSGREAADD